MSFASFNDGEETLHPPADFRKRKRRRFALRMKGMASTIFVATLMLITGKTNGMIFIQLNKN